MRHPIPNVWSVGMAFECGFHLFFVVLLLPHSTGTVLWLTSTPPGQNVPGSLLLLRQITLDTRLGYKRNAHSSYPVCKFEGLRTTFVTMVISDDLAPSDRPSIGICPKRFCS